MIKINVLKAFVLAGLMVSFNALEASGASSITFDFSGDVTPNKLAEMTAFVAQNTISKRDAVVSIAQVYYAMGQDCVRAIDNLKAADSQITEIEDREQFAINSGAKVMQEMLKIQRHYNLVFAIAQACLKDDGMFDEISRLFPVKMQEMLSDIESVEMPENDQDFVVFWYEVLEHATLVGLYSVSVESLIKYYPQYAQEIQAVLGLRSQSIRDAQELAGSPEELEAFFNNHFLDFCPELTQSEIDYLSQNDTVVVA